MGARGTSHARAPSSPMEPRCLGRSLGVGQRVSQALQVPGVDCRLRPTSLQLHSTFGEQAWNTRVLNGRIWGVW